MSLIYTSDNSTNGFDATSSGSLPSGWTAVAGTWHATATAGNLISAHVHDFEDTSQGATDLALYTGNGTAADMDVTFAQMMAAGSVVASTSSSSMAIVARSDATLANGYFAFWGWSGSAWQASIYKNVGGATTQVGSSATLPFTPTAGMVVLTRMTIIGTGANNIKLKVWNSTQAEPASALLAGSDSSVTAAGYAGVLPLSQIASIATNLSSFNVDSIASSSNNITTLSPTAITASGGNITVSGTYNGTAPTAMDVSVDGGSYSALSGFSAGSGTWSGTVAAPANGIHSIDARDHNNMTHTSPGIYIVSGAGTASIAPNDAGMVYSPYNWYVTSGNAKTINPGAYFKTLFTGTTCVLNFDAGTMQSPASQIWWRVDNGPWTKADIASTISLTIPSLTLSNADVSYHLLEVIYKSQDGSSSANRWNPASTGTAVNFTGLTLDSGASVAAPSTLSKNLLIYGDSITEGIRTVGETAANVVDQNDAQMCWSYQLGKMLGCEVGVVGFGGSGFNAASYGGVPNFQTTYNLIYSGQSRTFSPAPDLIVCNYGVNDLGASSTTTAATVVFNALLAATLGTTAIVQLQPLPAAFQSASSYIQAAVTGIGNSRLSYVSTTGILNTALGVDSTLAHPSGPNDQGSIAPQLAELLRPYLYPATGGAAVGGFVIGG